MNHETTNLTPPPNMRQRAIDKAIAPLIKRLWRLGLSLTTAVRGNYRGSSDRGQEGVAPHAYIGFRSWLEACLFAAIAGPLRWSNRIHRERNAERPELADRWAWDWRLEGNIVRFPSRNITRATGSPRSFSFPLDVGGGVSTGRRWLRDGRVGHVDTELPVNLGYHIRPQLAHAVVARIRPSLQLHYAPVFDVVQGVVHLHCSIWRICIQHDGQRRPAEPHLQR